MKKKEEYLNYNNQIKIKSYNYQQSNGFSQETAVDTLHGTYKEHKFIVEIEGVNYALEFRHSHVVNKYAAMEDEWVELENTLEDDHNLKIKKFTNENYHSELPQDVSFIKNINEDIKQFRDLLIKTAEEIGIGCHYSSHFNREDDFCRTYPDVQNSKPYSISNKALFIEDNEKSFFEDFLKLKTHEDEQSFLYNVEQKIIEEQKEIIEEQKNKEKEKEAKRKEEIALIVNPILEKIDNVYKEIEHLENYIYFDTEGSKYTIEELQNAVNNFDNIKKDQPYIFPETKEMLERLVKKIPECEVLKEDVLKHISEAEYEDIVFKQYSGEGLTYPAERQQAPWDYPDFDSIEFHDYEEHEPEEISFQSQDEWLEHEYNKPRTLAERFESIKTYINNELSNNDIPEELKETFGIKNEVKDFLGNMINKQKQSKPLKRKI